VNWVKFKVDDVELYAAFDESGIVEVGGCTASDTERRVVLITSEKGKPYLMGMSPGTPFILQLGLGRELSGTTLKLSAGVDAPRTS
jgi:hypothetical protein